ncbi:MAG: fibrobacter succinogenes major paralogous domain-containing protein [Mediterranea sp.]|nr:fibrobacter succinogenes major paralogous domain-containing protein [Mediterranea sp.]
MVTLYPASGYRDSASGTFTNTGSRGYAWSCALTGVLAHYLGFYLSIVYPTSSSYRAHSFSVRCVQHLHCLDISVL